MGANFGGNALTNSSGIANERSLARPVAVRMIGTKLLRAVVDGFSCARPSFCLLFPVNTRTFARLGLSQLLV